jgi:hypothetical protein
MCDAGNREAKNARQRHDSVEAQQLLQSIEMEPFVEASRVL